jgi:hypothetical protein
VPETETEMAVTKMAVMEMETAVMEMEMAVTETMRTMRTAEMVREAVDNGNGR